MTDFSKRLLEQVSKNDSGELLKDYLSDDVIDSREPRSGRLFEKFQASERKPNEITPSDLLAVSQLSMKIGGYQEGDSIPDSAVIKLFNKELQKRVSKSLAKIKTNWRLETISPRDLKVFNDEISKLWPILRDEVGLKKVATFKLLARKRPHMCPIRDSFAERALGKPKNWYASWQDAFNQERKVVSKLKTLRDGNSGAKHISLLRVADIIIWERQKQKDESNNSSKPRSRVG